MARQQVKVSCPDCGGLGYQGEAAAGGAVDDAWPCAACEGDGERLATCITCQAPAFQMVGPGDPVCDGCAAMCTLCEGTTPDDDRLYWGAGGAVVHVACALRFEPALLPRSQILETALASEEAVSSIGARALARARAHPPAGEITVPKPSDDLIEAMRRQGFIASMEAVKRSGHSLTTIYEWINAGRLKAQRSGLFHFVEEKSLNQVCPQTRRAS